MNNLPIFITGFQSSGTTLVRRIVSMHPALKYELLHEGKRLMKYKSSDEALLHYHIDVKQAGKLTGAVASIESGEKIPYYNNAGFIKDYIRRWKDWWHDGMIIHVDRNIDDVTASCNRKFDQDITKTKRIANEDIPDVKDFLSQFSNIIWMNYDRIVSMPYNAVNTLYSVMGDFKEDSKYISKVCNTKDPWMHNGRVMCGLRYGNKIERLHTYE